MIPGAHSEPLVLEPDPDLRSRSFDDLLYQHFSETAPRVRDLAHRGARPAPTPVAGLWSERALCRTRPDLDFAAGYGVPSLEMREVCEACPVNMQCLEELIEMNPQHVGRLRAGFSNDEWQKVRP